MLAQDSQSAGRVVLLTGPTKHISLIPFCIKLITGVIDFELAKHSESISYKRLQFPEQPVRDRAHDHDCSFRKYASGLHVEDLRSHEAYFPCDWPEFALRDCRLGTLPRHLPPTIFITSLKVVSMSALFDHWQHKQCSKAGVMRNS